jgi:hypothetical protein
LPNISLFQAIGTSITYGYTGTGTKAAARTMEFTRSVDAKTATTTVSFLSLLLSDFVDSNHTLEKAVMALAQQQSEQDQQWRQAISRLESKIEENRELHLEALKTAEVDRVQEIKRIEMRFDERIQEQHEQWMRIAQAKFQEEREQWMRTVEEKFQEQLRYAWV